jgi:hypothetical protein
MLNLIRRAALVLALVAATAIPVYGFASCIVFVSSWGPTGSSPTGTINITDGGNDSDKEGTFKTDWPYVSKKGPIYGGPWTSASLSWTSVPFDCLETTESALYNLTMWGNTYYGGTNWQWTSAPCGGGGGPM